MLVALVSVSASAEKRTEVFQTLGSLAPLVRETDGCVRCELSQECGDDASFTFIEEWRSRASFDEHLRSRCFGVLLGLGPLLKKPIEVSLCTLVAREGPEAVRKTRSLATASGAGALRQAVSTRAADREGGATT